MKYTREGASCQAAQPGPPDPRLKTGVCGGPFIKAILRGPGARIRDALVEAIRLAVDAITCDDAVAWFTHAGYSLPAESA